MIKHRILTAAAKEAAFLA